jgi:ribosomal-protein-alanine N-acetyltransferase
MTTTLRPMTAGDVPRVLALEAEIFSHPWTEGILRDELSAPRRTYLVAEDGGSIVGYGGVMLVEEDAHITNLAVAPAHRGRGVATRIYLELVDVALGEGAENLTLEVRLGNVDARRLYSRFGFAPVGIRKDYYVDDDALIMWVTEASGEEYRARLLRIREGLR